MLKTDTLFQILRKNMFNIKEPDTTDCEDGSKVYHGESSYIISVTWDDFIASVDTYIDRAYALQDKIDDYIIYKEVE